jgi:2-polyprenyl-6-methoxyphenol hydroxylase-like FAD-dependent oxidoreductase
MQKTDVCIVGGGANGLLLSLLLSQKGYQVTLLEQQNQLEARNRGPALLLQPGTLKLFETMGTLEQLLADAEKIYGVEEYGAKGLVYKEKYGAVAPSSVPSFGIILPIGSVKQALLDRLHVQSNFLLSLNTEVVRMTKKGENWRVHVSQGAREWECEADIIVGCDGKDSTIRRLVDIPTRFYPFTQLHLLMRVSRPRDWSLNIRFYHPSDFLFTIPVKENSIQILYQIAKEDLDHWRSQPVTALTDRIAEIEPQLMESLLEITDWKQVLPIEYHTVQPENWWKDNVVLLGDSAHAMHSFGGQGLNSSLQDSVYLSTVIPEVLQSGDRTPLKIYERVRKPYIQYFQQLQRTYLFNLLNMDYSHRSLYKTFFEYMALGQPELRALYMDSDVVALDALTQ